jgi:hypothetical protein
MSGWVLKRATTTYMGMANWQKRYLWLKDEKLYFYGSDDPKATDEKAKKVINMKNVQCVCYHYDSNAPIKSNKMSRKDKMDKSRFDIYTPGRIFNMKSEFEDSLNSDLWISMLQKCGAHFNSKYDTKFL